MGLFLESLCKEIFYSISFLKFLYKNARTIAYESEEEAIVPPDLTRFTSLVEDLLDELAKSIFPWVRITCSEITLCMDVNELRVAEEDEYPVSERFIMKSERIRASLDDRICLLYPRSVIEPILSLMR